MRKFFMLSFALVMMLLTVDHVFAHPGGRDELGGHFRRSDCTYFLHEPTSIARSAKNMQELIALIKKYNSNSKCINTLNESKVDLEGFTFSNGTPSTNPTPNQTKPAPKPTPQPQLQLGQKYSATLAGCTDGDTANFVINGKTYKTRFLYIDTPESTTQVEPFGKEASEFTCTFLKSGKITLETDGNSLFDKYDRLLAWVWVGDKLHQEEITKAGLVEDFYDYGNYKYEDRIHAAMEYAKTNYTGMYASLKPAEQPKSTEDNKSEGKPEESKEDDAEKFEENKETKSKDEQVKTDESNKNDDKEGRVVKNSDEQVASQQVATEDPTALDYVLLILVLILVIVFFKIPKIKGRYGVRPLIAHKLRSRRTWLNIILGIIYLFFWFIILIIVVMEFVHLNKTKKHVSM